MKAEETWSEQIQELKIPYPEKLLLSVEIDEHLLHRSDEADSRFSDEALREFYQIHNTGIYKYLDQLSPGVRKLTEIMMSGVPMMGFLIFLGKEKFMFEFIRQGGVGMAAIVVIGAGLLLRELVLFFRVVVIKDHSKINLNLESSSVIVGALALISLGVAVTCLGIYVSASSIATSKLPLSIFLSGLAESITAVIVGTCFATTVLLLHFMTRKLMILWKAPIAG